MRTLYGLFPGAVAPLASMGWAIAQVPPPPPLRGDAATLKDTMKFIQDKLPGKVNYAVYAHDNVTGADRLNKRSMELSDVSAVSAGAESCSITFHFRFDNGKGIIVEKDWGVFLKLVDEITLAQWDQLIEQANAKAGHPEVSAKVDPAVFLVVVKSRAGSPFGGDMTFNFYDEAMADRVAKALQHAVDLCGGGNQEPF
ncbi:MAG: hypothetical protein ABSF98_17105 [Bryobacteraceae bacterium]|jgi:hypothetical protein